MKLKTLKNLIERGGVTINSGKRLQAEAVKWYKLLISEGYDEKNSELLNWIRCFFNLTEEDLK